MVLPLPQGGEEGQAEWGAPLPRGAGVAARGGDAAGPAASWAPVLQPRVREPPRGERFLVRLPHPLSALYRSLAATVGAEAPTHPGCCGHRRGTATPHAGRPAGGLCGASPHGLCTAAVAPVSSPRVASTRSRGLSSPAPPPHHPIRLPWSMAFSRSACARIFLTLTPSTPTPPCPPSGTTPLAPSWVRSLAQSPAATFMPIDCKTRCFTSYSFIKGPHPTVIGYTRALYKIFSIVGVSTTQ